MHRFFAFTRDFLNATLSIIFWRSFQILETVDLKMLNCSLTASQKAPFFSALTISSFVSKVNTNRFWFDQQEEWTTIRNKGHGWLFGTQDVNNAQDNASETRQRLHEACLIDRHVQIWGIQITGVRVYYMYLHWWHATITLTTLLQPTPLPDLQYARHGGREGGTFHQFNWCMWQLHLGYCHWWIQESRHHIVRIEWVA